MPKYLELRARAQEDGTVKSTAVYRKTVEPFDHHGRQIVVGLEPGDVISFREAGTRKTYTIDIKWAYAQAIKKSVRGD